MDFTLLYDEADVLHQADVRQGTAFYGNNIRPLPGFNTARFAFNPEQSCSVDRCGLQCMLRLHASSDQQHKLPAILPVRRIMG